MKKLTTLLLAAGLVVSSFSGAQAGEFIPNAQFINQYVIGDGGAGVFDSGEDTEHFETALRLRMGFDYIASESLSGTFLAQIGHWEYGRLDGYYQDANAFRVRLMYVDWVVPTTDVKVRMGLQPVALPAFVAGSTLLAGRGTGITVAAPVNENVSLTGAWIRPDSKGDSNNTTVSDGDDSDIFALIADFNYEGFRIAPYAAFLTMGHNVADLKGDGNVKFPAANFDGATAWVIGASFELSMFDPFKFALDAYYSSADANYDNGVRDQDMNGFFVAASATYKTQYGIPGLKAWYASGNDKINGTDLNLGQPVTLIGGFAPTTIMFEDQVLELDYANQTEGNAGGTWGVLLEWKDFSFVEKLSHTARIAYIGGTNEEGSSNNQAASSWLGYLYDDESVVEVNFNTSYEIYKNFTATLQLGWVTADLEEKHRLAPGGKYEDSDDDIFRSALSFVYKF